MKFMLCLLYKQIVCLAQYTSITYYMHDSDVLQGSRLIFSFSERLVVLRRLGGDYSWSNRTDHSRSNPPPNVMSPNCPTLGE